MRPAYRTLVLALFFGAGNFVAKGQPTPPNHWETAVNAGDFWKYFLGTSEPTATWNTVGFNDTGWSQGPGGIGFGDGDDGTTVTTVNSIYTRRTFTIADTSQIAEAMLSVDYDDGFVAYLNGVEVVRVNVGTYGSGRPAYSDYANSSREALLYQGGEAEHFVIPKRVLRTCLQNGTNVLAIQTHNVAASADLTCLAWLHFGVTVSGTQFGPNPAWFQAPMFSSNLPLVFIDTDGGLVADDPRINATMGIIENGVGNRNYVGDSLNHYQGRISIEIRGSTSQQYPKKSYGVETQDALGNNDNVSLLGMPKENDWILYGAYPDKTLMRNELAYYLFSQMGHYSPRYRQVELFVNGEYLGVYTLLEKLKIDKNRVDIPSVDADDLAGDSLTGGYMVKIDKLTSGGVSAWTSPLDPEVWFQFHDPDYATLLPAQRTYMQNVVSNFENALNGPNFADPDLGYRAYIDVQSFMDFLIMQELGRTVDGYRSSSFLFKNRDSDGGRLFAGPMWDFNLSFGNADYCDAYLTSGWQYQFNTVCSGFNPHVPFWWSKFWQDPNWALEFRCHWNDLRSGPFHTDSIHAWIDAKASELQESQTRNFQRWPILGVYVNWNYFVGNTYQEEIDYLKSYIAGRLSWMDANFPNPNGICGSMGAENVRLTEINYHSALTAEAGDWFELHNGGAAAVDLSGYRFRDGNPADVFTIPDGTLLNPGDYLVLAQDTTLFKTAHPGISNVIGPFHFSLGNGGDGINLFDAMYLPVLSMRYDATAPWPAGADGLGYTLEVLDSAGNLSDPANWFAGCLGGSPGEAYQFPCGGVHVTDPWAGTLQIFPNPFHEELTLRWTEIAGNGQAISLIIRDLAGRTVWRGDLGSSGEAQLGLGSLPAGMYVYEAWTGEGRMASGRIAKVK